MRTPRVVIIVAFLLTIFMLGIAAIRNPSGNSVVLPQSSDVPNTGTRAGLFSFNTPLSLFPPNAIISLTDDNTTAFQARPAAFGPILPASGLSGRLWIGSGFGEEDLRQGITSAGVEGELGCSDVPGWLDSIENATPPFSGAPGPGRAKDHKKHSKNEKRAFVDRTAVPGQAPDKLSGETAYVDDGTDDHYHPSLLGSTASKIGQVGQSSKNLPSSKNNHADIQSLQESAEINGKVVLLSRGGCGFLEKVKWVQRRGGIALIVGDDTRGGPLIQMYARGDTSNVTIPAIFTSHTTAHLLSSLIPAGSYIEDTIDEDGKAATKVQQAKRPKKAGKKGTKVKSTPTAPISKATAPPVALKEAPIKVELPLHEHSSWFSWFYSNSGDDGSKNRRPSKNDWVLVDDWEEEIAKKPAKKPKVAPKPSLNDDFVIGVQDWRDPDLVDIPSKELAESPNSPDKNSKGKKSRMDSLQISATESEEARLRAAAISAKKVVDFKGGSITPGSGEYVPGKEPKSADLKTSESDRSGLMSTLFGEEDDDSKGQNSVEDYEQYLDEELEDDEDDTHEGLWVTLTQTNGASPFFDTLLVLVVSPLVTLTVVYALLLLRSRIRRRRWRAPKSVVERLPVRTYQTLVPSVGHSRLPSPTSTSPSTPLLQQAITRPRPRSRTTSGLPEPGNLLRSESDSLQTPRLSSRGHEHEKAPGVASEWKKYMGKQVECVVCLEEYVDGISRVMSLPCGHEFHVDCITPWLTTRRRTCPICKGDVVRSLARGATSSPRYEPYRDDDDDIQYQAAESSNDSPSAALPIGRTSDAEDLETGIVSPIPSRPRITHMAGSWRSLIATSLSSTSRSPRPPQEDRSR